jgi:PQQ-dependent catabolism-associated CXXCW motif protein
VRWALLLLVFAVATSASGQPLWTHGDEAEDFGIAPRAELRIDGHTGPTPLGIPGARTIATAEVRKLIQAPPEKRPLLFDAIGEDRHPSLPGAIWLPGAGGGTSFEDEIQARLARILQLATLGDRSRPVIFFCAGPRCWLSYNAALRAVRLGYSGVRWYRGGIEAWGAGGGALTEPRLGWPRSETHFEVPIR